MDWVVSRECIFYNPKTEQCHKIDPCDSFGMDCIAKERAGVKKDDETKDD